MHPVPEPNAYDWDSAPDHAVRDILSDDFTTLWHGTAATNTEILEKIFRPLPNDHIATWEQYAEYLKPAAGIATGHVADRNLTLGEVKDMLQRVRGHLVQMPLKFLEVSPAESWLLSRRSGDDRCE
jgi:phospholipase D1/2